MSSRRTLWGILKGTVENWLSDQASSISAALAFYCAFSIAPLLVIVVTFVGSWTKPTSGNPAGAFIFLEIDNNRVDVTSTNGGVLVHEGTATSVSNGTHGFTFVTEPIAPGTHVAKMRWADNVLNGSGTICVFERSLVIHHF